MGGAIGVVQVNAASFLSRLILGAAAAAIGVTADAAQGPPPPASPGIEILAPTARSHLVIPRCGTTRSRIRWQFDGKVPAITSATLLGRHLSKSDLEAINKRIAGWDDDVFIRVDCNGSGAIVTAIQSQLVGSDVARQVRFDYDGDGLAFVWAREGGAASTAR